MAISSDDHEVLPLSTIFSFLFFGTNFLFYLLFLLHEHSSKLIAFISSPLSSSSLTISSSTTITTTPSSHKKKLSAAFDGTLTCYHNLTTELFFMGAIIILTYIFENYWIFEHSQKEYSRDLFLFVCVVFFLYALYTIKPITDLSLLGRDQTEEWKGWMQFIFLLYHYFHAEEVYNSVRVMITCYVWMTGFGNFSFFYMKQDFGWLRVVQMLWRLNFAVFFLMMVHSNTYILYYICPLHTFYFCMVYLTMFLWQSVNHAMWGIRFKLFILGLLIFLIWDTSGDIFDTVFFFLGTDSVIGAKSGSLWEWYFRSSLDHWSTFYGMIFALNFPLAEQYFKVASGWSLAIASVALLALSVWWYQEIYCLDKLAYNLAHSYFAFIPLTAYIFFRNLTPSIRSGVSMSLHLLGKTTLETYLLQHHVWLTSNAKTLLTLVPGMPWVNFALASVLFYFLSHELYRLTMSLRGMILPENKDIAWRNMIGSTLLLLFFALIAFVLQLVGVTWLGIGLSCLVLFLLLSVPMKRYGKGGGFDNEAFHTLWKRMALVCILLFFTGAGYQFVALPSSSPSISSSSSTSLSTTSSSLYENPSLIHQCQTIHLTAGHWARNTNCPPLAAPALAASAHCLFSEWKWNQSPNVCRLHQIRDTEAGRLFHSHRIHFIGDSTVRAVYHRLNKLLTLTYQEPLTDKHQDLLFTHRALNTTVEFHWAPFLANATQELSQLTGGGTGGKGVVFILGSTLWDLLHLHDPSSYDQHLHLLQKTLERHEVDRRAVFWLLPLQVVDEKLNTAEKREFMREKAVEEYRQQTLHSSLQNSVQFINSLNVTRSREEETVDGVHYTPEIYDVLTQLIANTYLLDHHRDLLAKGAAAGGAGTGAPKSASATPPSRGKPTGSMSNTANGLLTLVVALVMLITWDNFFGLGWLSLKLLSRSYDWNDAYLPLLKKILPHRESHGHDAEEGRGGGRGDEEGEEKKPLIELVGGKD
jgi:N-acetylneuraminate 9-O-acetyltransferase